MGKIRDAIVARPESWQQIKDDEAFTALYTLSGDSLKRAPKGYDLDHPLIEDLRRKDFVASLTLSEADVCAPDFIDIYASYCHKNARLMAFLTTALGLPW